VPDVAVAFPNDDPTAQLIVSRLGDAGIAARVDRGLAVSWQLPARGQLRVVVDERDALRAHKVLGTSPREAGSSEGVLRLAVAALVIVIGFGLAVIAALLLR
jgi:hypothetical protein